MPSPLSVAVVGAGAFGSACTARLSACGARVTLIDASAAPNASAVAAGMIAPAFEAVLEDADAGRADLYRSGAGRWPQFAAAFGLELARDGADWIGPTQEIAGRFERLGFAYSLTQRGLHTDEDFRLEPRAALARLSARATNRLDARVEALRWGEAGIRVQTPDEEATFDAVVLATGWTDHGLRLDGPGAAELRVLLDRVTPVRGQIVAVRDVQVARPTRAAGVYVVPRPGAVLVGATMEPGRSDLAPDPAATRSLLEAADQILPGLSAVPTPRLSVAVGVRGAQPNGAPIAGRSPAPGVFVALAPRRNGWLFAPMVAEAVARAVFGESPERGDQALQPGSFVS